MKLHVRHKLKDESPTVWIGKDGLTPKISIQIDKQLERNKMIKVKILKTALKKESSSAIAARAAEQTGSSLVEVRGHVFILYRRHKKSESTS
jgi:RNA-binding protein